MELRVFSFILGLNNGVDLEDINTKRLSLRIQLAQLIKEKSLLLYTTVNR